ALANDPDALVEYIHRDIGFFFGHDERWSDSNRARTATPQEHSPLKGEFDDAVAFCGAIFFRLLVFDNLDPDHKTAAANVADNGVPGGPISHSFHHVTSDLGGIAHQAFALDHVERRQRGSDADRVAAECGRVRTRNPVHNLGFTDHNPQRHSRRDALRAANDVGVYARMFDGPPFSGAPDSALHFVDDQQDAMPVADSPQFLHEDIRGNDISAFPLNRLHENGRHLLRGKRGLEEFVFNKARASESERLGVLRATFAPAIHVGIANVSDARNQWRKTPLLLRL